jgi:hypothetical protein
MAASTALCLATWPAAAQPPGDAEKAEASALFEQGQAALDRKDYASACPKLKEVTRLLPNGVGGHITLGQCYEAFGRLASAWSAYSTARRLAARASRAEQEKDARIRADAIEPRLARLSIVVPEAMRSVSGLTVDRDGSPVDDSQWSTAFPVDRGQHVVVVTAPGRQRWEKAVEVGADGVTVTVEVPLLMEVKVEGPVTLPAQGPAASPVQEPVGPPPVDGPRPASQSARIAAFTLLGAGGVSAIVGAVFSARTASAYSSFNAHPTRAGADETLTNAHIADATWGTAGALGVAGLVVLLVGRRSPSQAPRASQIFVTPEVGPRAGGISAGVRF